MSLRDIKSIIVWERRNERGAYSVKIICNDVRNNMRFRKSPYKFFRGEYGIRQAAATLLIRQTDEVVYRKICKLIHASNKKKEKVIWCNPLFPSEEENSNPSFGQRLAMENADELRELQAMYEANGSC